MKTNFLVKLSFAICIIAVVATFFVVFDLLGVISGNGSGDWFQGFLWIMIIGWILFGLTNLSQEVRNFWKTI